MTFLGGYIAFFKQAADIYGLPAPLAAGLAFMLGLTACLMILVVLFPKIRHSAEAVALSLPVLSLMGAFSGGADAGISSFTNVSGILLCYLIVTVYGGAWVDRYIPCTRRRVRSSATTKLSLEEIWPYLAVTPDTFADYGREGTLSMEWIEPGVSYREICRAGELAKIEEIHRIEVDEPHQRYRFAFKVPDAKETASSPQGSKEFRLSPIEHGTKLETVRESTEYQSARGFFSGLMTRWAVLTMSNSEELSGCSVASVRKRPFILPNRVAAPSA